MNNIAIAPSRVGNDESFPSAAALRAAHSRLLRRERAERDQPAFRDEVLAFIQRGRVTGKILDDDAERWASQSMLDYWSTVFYQIGEEPIDSTLDEFDPALAPYIPEANCPYLGLESFSETRHALFFGRRRMIDEYLNYLARQRMLAVVGSSGTGKSSLVLGGVIPELQEGALAGSAAWGMCRG